MRVRAYVVREAVFHRVREDVVGYGLQVFVSAQGSVKVARLPELVTGLLLVPETGQLLEAPGEFPQVRPGIAALHKQVDVIRHEAVGKNCELSSLRGLKEDFRRFLRKFSV
jgi:hypothetical protein